MGHKIYFNTLILNLCRLSTSTWLEEDTLPSPIPVSAPSFLPQPNRHWLHPPKITTSKTNSPHNPYSFRFLLISKTTKNQVIFIKQAVEGSRHLATALRLHPFLTHWAWGAQRKTSPANTVRLSKAQEVCRSSDVFMCRPPPPARCYPQLQIEWSITKPLVYILSSWDPSANFRLEKWDTLILLHLRLKTNSFHDAIFNDLTFLENSSA